jgi:sulfite exporter TauE/SafE
MNPGYLLALTTGLLGSFGHCIGMCGPIVASQALASQSATAQTASRSVLRHVLYNAGRITTYGAIGAIMGLSGSFVNTAGRMAGIQDIVVIIAGCVMILMGASIVVQRNAAAWIEKHNAPVLRFARRFVTAGSASGPFALGLVMGLLPCGLSYTIFIAAAGSGTALSGMLTSVLFGLGTMPALLLFGSLISTLGSRVRGRIYRLSGVFVIAMGAYFILRGAKLHAGL